MLPEVHVPLVTVSIEEQAFAPVLLAAVNEALLHAHHHLTRAHVPCHGCACALTALRLFHCCSASLSVSFNACGCSFCPSADPESEIL